MKRYNCAKSSPNALLISFSPKLFHLEEHFKRVGGDKTVIDACESLRLKLVEVEFPIRSMRDACQLNYTTMRIVNWKDASLRGV